MTQAPDSGHSSPSSRGPLHPEGWTQVSVVSCDSCAMLVVLWRTREGEIVGCEGGTAGRERHKCRTWLWTPPPNTILKVI